MSKFYEFVNRNQSLLTAEQKTSFQDAFNKSYESLGNRSLAEFIHFYKLNENPPESILIELVNSYSALFKTPSPSNALYIPITFCSLTLDPNKNTGSSPTTIQDLINAANELSSKAHTLTTSWNSSLMKDSDTFKFLCGPSYGYYSFWWSFAYYGLCQGSYPTFSPQFCPCLNVKGPPYISKYVGDPTKNPYLALKPFLDFMTGDLKTFIELVNGNITLLSPKAETWFAQTFNTKQSWGHSYSDLPTTLVSPLCPGCPQVADLLNFYPIAQKFYPFNSQIDLYQALQNAPTELNES